jgi:MarR family transcriptional regulator, negative regulator of the multidrug operon emrRAB
MSYTDLQFDALEANLGRLSACVPDLPMLELLVTRLIAHTGRGLAALLDHHIRPFGLAEAEFRVLATLSSRLDGSAHPGELCAQTSQSPANMSRISDALVARGLITRVSSEQDRRRMVLRISESGEQLVRCALPTLFAVVRTLLTDSSGIELAQLVTQLKRLSFKVDEAMGRLDA